MRFRRRDWEVVKKKRNEVETYDNTIRGVFKGDSRIKMMSLNT